MTDKAIQPEAQSGLLTRRLVGIKEVAGYIGLSVHTVYAMVSQRRIPYVKVGRLTKFDLSMLDTWIKKNTFMPVSHHRLDTVVAYKLP